MEGMLNEDLAKNLTIQTAGLSIENKLHYLAKTFPDRVCFSTSFSLEDQVITDFIFSIDVNICVFTLDTGRHFEETHKVHSRTLEHYNKHIKVFHPEASDVEALLNQKGPYSFYESVENRKECCHIRKVKPLRRALKNKAIWITGIRSAQSENRETIAEFSFDPINQLIKFNPLANWTKEEVTAYISSHHVPYNALSDRGFTSIGCAPCTRAANPEGEFRSGRWWWEHNSTKECGLHENEK